jgi:hypothetical protein
VTAVRAHETGTVRTAWTSIVWLWSNPAGRGQGGTCASIGIAQRQAEKCLRAGAPSVVVESAVVLGTDPRTRQPVFRPTGHRWTATLYNGLPVWGRKLPAVIS